MMRTGDRGRHRHFGEKHSPVTIAKQQSPTICFILHRNSRTTRMTSHTMTSHTTSAELECSLPRPMALPRPIWSLQRQSQGQHQPHVHHEPRFGQVLPPVVKPAQKNGVPIVSDDESCMFIMSDSTDSGGEEESWDGPSRGFTSKG